jgi:hypothetical protein
MISGISQRSDRTAVDLTLSESPPNPMKALQALYYQAISLRDLAYKDREFNPASGRDQYQRLKVRLVSLDKSAGAHLPDIEWDSDFTAYRSLVRIAVNQLLSYIEGKYVAHGEEPKTSPAVGPVVNFLMMLPNYGLTVKWAVAAAMLSSLEVMTNVNLTRLKIPYDSSESFDKRLNKLNNALIGKNIAIPSLMLSALYKVRNKVIHEGNEPTNEEMTTISDLLSSS